MEYNILSKVASESIQVQAESLEEYFERRRAGLQQTAKLAADRLLPDAQLPRDDDTSGASTPRREPLHWTLPRHTQRDKPPEDEEAGDEADVRPSILPIHTLLPVVEGRRGIRGYKNLPECWTRNFIKGVAVGGSARMAVGVMAAVWVTLRSKRKASRLRVLVTHLLQLEAQPLQFGLFLGALLSTYNSIMYATRRARGSVGHYRAAAAAAAAAWALLFLPRGARRVFGLVTFMRALEVGTRMGTQRGWLPVLPYADVVLMAAASARVMWCWIFRPQALEAPYLAFINRISGKPESFLHAVPHLFRPHALIPPVLRACINEDRTRLALPPLPSEGPLNIQVIMHKPHETTLQHFVRYTREGIGRTLQVYLPVHVLPLLLFNSPRLARFPLATTTRTVEGVLRSAAFLAVYCSLGWLGLRFAIPAAVASTAPAPPSPLLQVAAGHAAGALCALALLLEKPSRRIELALYVAMQAVRTLFNAHLKGNHGVLARQLKKGEVALFSASLAVVMHAYALHPNTIRPSYHRLMLRFFDGARQLHKPLIGM